MPSRKTLYGRSPWLDDFPKSRVPNYARQRGPQQTDVAIVGGGLTGCATAYAFAAAGIRVVLLEQGQIGRGVTASRTGWVTDDPGVPFLDVARMLGLRAARDAYGAWRRAALDLGALVRRVDLKCHWAPRGQLVVARSNADGVRLARETKARRAAGLDARALTKGAASSQAGLDAASGLSTSHAARLDPYRAAVGLAAAASARGGQCFERSPVRAIRFTEKYVDVETGGGTIRAGRVVVATGTPGPLFKALDRHFSARTFFAALTDVVPVPLRDRIGVRQSLLSDSAQPPHYVEWATDAQLLAVGAEAADVPARLLAGTLVQRTGQLMYELSTLYPDVSGIAAARGWAIPYVRTSDGLPVVGPHRNYPRHLFVYGECGLGVTGSYLASRLLLKHHLGDADRSDEVFGFPRCLR
jgi:glycine/D-amino acid oxidase-like deaminating enzyme